MIEYRIFLQWGIPPQTIKTLEDYSHHHRLYSRSDTAVAATWDWGPSFAVQTPYKNQTIDIICCNSSIAAGDLSPRYLLIMQNADWELIQKGFKNGLQIFRYRIWRNAQLMWWTHIGSTTSKHTWHPFTFCLQKCPCPMPAFSIVSCLFLQLQACKWP